jgi:hypothetical protein
MSEIKAIETNYRGRKFRSRLEARWAIFFDGLGIEWEYEPEGFTLPSGKRYLPDFLLTYQSFDFGPWQCWAEVKRRGEPVIAEDLVRDAIKVAELAVAQDFSVLYLDGPPDYSLYSLASRSKCGDKWGMSEDEVTLWSKNARPWYGADDYDANALRHNERYSAAVTAALSARFERGDAPVPISAILKGGRLGEILRQGGYSELA